ncbi:hypothetical protein BJ138DRAFT_1148867 [Hygrophoropsis aurantiaca]|uniref:Uncharacterized protein n=1 Tax=Hygrophoropsis aurantiaca TaxID=72124 RepID=A0ACB8AI85_9AGAM|nr:hypothetical protein BJ138DRAFT_1148867 [Hygrophoropsis aurantiaca]
MLEVSLSVWHFFILQRQIAGPWYQVCLTGRSIIVFVWALRPTNAWRCQHRSPILPEYDSHSWCRTHGFNL